MKKFLLSALGASVLFLTSQKANAQAFVTQADTVYQTVSGAGDVLDPVTNKTSSLLTIQWHVIASDFPANWLPTTGVCDNNNCYINSKSVTLWNGSFGSTFTSNPYAPDSAGLFSMSITLADTCSTGTHYMTASLTGGGTTKTVTFIITHNPAAVPTVNKNDDNIVVYPNPAKNQLNVIFNANTDAKTIAICNLIGNVVSVFKVNGNSAGMNIENLPTGVYFMRVMNSQGAVISTRRFAHQ